MRLRARHFVLAAGAIGSPGILLRSSAPDPNLTLGRRTFLHPTAVSAAVMPQRVEGYFGAPQSVYSDHFLDSLPLDGPAGYKLESAPTHPVLVGITLPGFGEEHARWMAKFPHVQVVIALLRDGFHPESQGGRVVLRRDGSPVLDYVMSPYLWDAARRAYLTMAEIQFAAGAQTVMPMHENARGANVVARGARRDRGPADEGARDARGERACDGRMRHGTRAAQLRRRRIGAPPPAREPLGSRRVDLPHQPRRQSPAFHLRDSPRGSPQGSQRTCARLETSGGKALSSQV